MRISKLSLLLKFFSLLMCVLVLSAWSPIHWISKIPSELRSLSYGPEAYQTLDVFLPGHNRLSSYPIVIFVYGGTWVQGEKEKYDFIGRAFADHGFVTVIPDYAKFPQVVFPHFVEDMAQAVAWVYAHVDSIKGDPSRVYLIGHSAGAHIASHLVFNPRYLRDVGVPLSFIRGFLGFAGPYDVDAFVKDQEADEVSFIFPDLKAANVLPFVRFRPRFHVCLFHGLEDQVVSVRQTKRLKDVLRDVNIPVAVYTYKGVDHMGLMYAFRHALRDYLPLFHHALSCLD